MEKLFAFIKDCWDTFIIGPAPDLNADHLIEGNATRSSKWMVTFRINRIVRNFPSKNFKFGKSGQPPFRAKKEDYREQPYSNMFLLLQSESADEISAMEQYYIRRYKHIKRNDNISDAIGHPMRSYDGKYHLYLVI